MQRICEVCFWSSAVSTFIFVYWNRNSASMTVDQIVGKYSLLQINETEIKPKEKERLIFECIKNELVISPLG